ncbi:MAG: response regulator [Longimonas sp.]|uniref:hybrid sensor histidine kinase/response regulator n=1 Tax=Longimonas sp. TaxID=2039626 RepID=UPI0033525405
MNPELLVATWSLPAGNQPGTDHTITHCNEAWRHVMGPMRSPWGRLGEEDQLRARDALQEAASGGLVTGLLVDAHTPGRDEPLPILLNAIPVRIASSPQTRTAYVGAITVTGEVLAEPSSWVPSQTKRHRMETLGRMTMGVAHDLNNLLSGLMGHLELVQEANVLHRLPEEERKSLDTVHRAAQDGASLIQKLQRYIRDDTEMHTETLSIEALIDDCLMLTRPYWLNEPRRKGIQIQVERNYEDTPPIEGVASELREVFVNLILNAVHAMPQGGTLRIRSYTCSHPNERARAQTKTPDAGSGQQARYVGVDVSDTGVGMDETVQARIFEPLFTTKGEEGTGLGLSATYSIMQEHNGSIAVESVPEKGSTFSLHFPCTDRREEASSENASSGSEGEGATYSILIVDDDPMVRRTIEKLLSYQGHTITPADSARAALEHLDSAPVDLIFTDFGMPEINGAELAERVHNAYPTIPIVLLSGYTDTAPALPHVDHVVTKPFTTRDLKTAISSVIAE